MYNTEPWLRECLDSVANQEDFKGVEDLEIICVNDGSTDGSAKILEEYAAKDPRFKVFYQQNQGVSVARNKALENATGKYIMFVDSDDVWQPNACKVAYEAITKDDVDIVEFGLRCFRDGKDNPTMAKNNYSSGGRAMSVDEYFADVPLSGCCWIVRASLIKNNDIKFPVGIKYTEDRVFNFMVCARASMAKIISAKLYNYRQRNSSACHTLISSAKFNFMCNSVKTTCNGWTKVIDNFGKEHILLTALIKWFHRGYKNLALKHAKEVLALFNQQIYNPAVVSKCDAKT